MSIRLLLESGEVVERSETSIAIGRSNTCQVVLENDDRIEPVHLTLRKMGNRWLAESSAPSQVCVDNSGPMQRHWLQNEGQVIRLTPNGPTIVFQPPTSPPTSPVRASQSIRPSQDVNPPTFTAPPPSRGPSGSREPVARQRDMPEPFPDLFAPSDRTPVSPPDTSLPLSEETPLSFANWDNPESAPSPSLTSPKPQRPQPQPRPTQDTYSIASDPQDTDSPAPGPKFASPRFVSQPPSIPPEPVAAFVDAAATAVPQPADLSPDQILAAKQAWQAWQAQRGQGQMTGESGWHAQSGEQPESFTESKSVPNRMGLILVILFGLLAAGATSGYFIYQSWNTPKAKTTAPEADPSPVKDSSAETKIEKEEEVTPDSDEQNATPE
jgi:hypothetical protein